MLMKMEGSGGGGGGGSWVRKGWESNSFDG